MWVALLLLGVGQASAVAQQVALQTQAEYRLIERKLADGSVESWARLSPYLVLTLRGPVWSGMNLYMDAGLTGSSTGDALTSVDQRNMQLNLIAQGTRLNLLATVNRNTTRLTSVGPTGDRLTALAVADSYLLAGVLSYPNYPTFSLQYQKGIARPESTPKVEVTNRLIGANYEWGAFRFTADDSQQGAPLAGVSSQTRTYGVNFNDSLLPTVRLRVDHYLVSAEAGSLDVGARPSTRSSITRAFVSALPTPFLTLDAELAIGTNDRNDGQNLGETSRAQESALSLRSEVLPGVRLDVSKRATSSHADGSSFDTGQLSANVAAQLLPTTSLVASWDRTTATDASAIGRRGQDGLQLSLSSDLSPATSLTANYGRRSFGAAGHDAQDTVSASIGAEHWVHPGLSVGAQLALYKQETTRGAERSQSTTQALQLDAIWIPEARWSLRAGLGVARSESRGSTLSLTPSLDLRWEADSATSATVQYDLRRIRQDIVQDGQLLATTGETSTGLTGRLTHRLANGGSLEVIYDYEKGLYGPFLWQKTLSLRYVRSF